MATEAESDPTPPPQAGDVVSLADERLLAASLDAARVLLDALASSFEDEAGRILDGSVPSVDLAHEARAVQDRLASLVAHRLAAKPGRRAALAYTLRALAAMVRRRAADIGSQR